MNYKTGQYPKGNFRWTPIRYVYVYGNGALWRANRADLIRIAAGEDWYDVLSISSARHLGGSRWKNLPKSLYAREGDRVESQQNGVGAISYDHMDADEAQGFLDYHLG